MRPADGEIIEVPLKSALLSGTIKDMLETIGHGVELDEGTEVPVQNVSAKTLKKIVEWANKWCDSPQPTSDEIKDKLADTIDSWDETFLKMDLKDLYDLVSLTAFIDNHWTR